MFWSQRRTALACRLSNPPPPFERTINNAFEIDGSRQISCYSSFDSNEQHVPNISPAIGRVFSQDAPRADFQSNHVFLWCHVQALTFEKRNREHNGRILNCYCVRRDLSGEPSSFYTAVMLGPGPRRSALRCGRVMATTLNKWSVISPRSPGVLVCLVSLVCVQLQQSCRPKRKIVAFPLRAGNAHGRH